MDDVHGGEVKDIARNSELMINSGYLSNIIHECNVVDVKDLLNKPKNITILKPDNLDTE